MKTRTRFTIIGFMTLFACDSPGAAVAGSTMPLIEGHTMTIEALVDGEWTTATLNFDDPESEDPVLQAFGDAVMGNCTEEVAGRFAGFQQSGTGDVCGVEGTRDQQLFICAAYFALDLADAVAPTDIFLQQLANDPEYTMRRRRPGDELDDETLGTRIFTIPVLRGHDAATAAILGGRLARDAIGEAVEALDASRCAEGSLAWQIDGTAEGEMVPVSFVLMTGFAESVDLIVESSQVAERLITAAASDRMATDSDPVRGRVNSWRARVDSRLEAASIWMEVPEELYETSPDPSALTSAGIHFPVVARVPSTDTEDVAMELLRTTRIDPRVDPSLEASGVLEGRVRAAMIEDAPSLASIPVGEFFERAGTNVADVRRMARSLVEEAEVRGRPIVPLSGPVGTAPRVSGTSTRREEIFPAYLIAEAGGATTRNDFPSLSDTSPPTDDVAETADYAFSGSLALLDAARSELAGALGRNDLGGAELEIADVVIREIHEWVEQRLRVCVGPLTDAGQGTIDIVLYGIDRRITPGLALNYEVWLGDDGLRCALAGQLEGADGELVDCDPDAYRITATPMVITTAGGSGLGPNALRWEIRVGDLPPSLSEGLGVRPGEHLYVTSRFVQDGEPGTAPETGESGPPPPVPSPQRHAIAGFGVDPGTAPGTYSRCTFFPVGGGVQAVVQRTLAADEAAPWDPETTCAGVPRDVALPLEDEIAESGSTSDVVEQVFLHYLSRAEQAASRAEVLGERLIAEEVELQSIAEQAVERVNQICGTSLSASFISIAPPDTCAVDSECVPGAHCADGRCIGGSIVDLLDADEADLTRLRSCLGEGDELAVATLGTVPVCGWHATGGRLCGCAPGETCPENRDALACLSTLDAAQCDAHVAALPGPDAAYVSFHSEPLALIPADSIRSSPSPISCEPMAVLRALANDPSGVPAWRRLQAYEAVRNSAWLRPESFRRAAELLVMEGDFEAMYSLSRGGQPWLATGSFALGPAEVFPCEPHDYVAGSDGSPRAELCGAAGPGGASVLCAEGASCAAPSGRIGVARRLDDALEALVTLSSVRIPRVRIGMSAFRGGPSDFAVVNGGLESLPMWFESYYGASGLFQRSSFLLADSRRPGGCIWLDSTTVIAGTSCAAAGFDPGLDTYGFEPAGPVAVGTNPWIPFRRPGDAARTPLMDRLLEGLLYGDVDEDGAWIAYSSFTENTLTNRQVLDAMELTCLALQANTAGCPADLDHVPDVRNMDDMGRLESQLRCVADGFSATAERLVFVDVPRFVAEDLRVGTVSGTYPRFSGEYGVAVGQLRSQMENIVRQIGNTSAIVAGFANDLALARSRGRVVSTEATIAELQTEAEVLNQIFGCAASAMPNVGSGGASWNSGSIFVCLNAVTQVILTERIADLRMEIAEEDALQIRIQLSDAYFDRMQALSESTHSLAESFAAVNATLSGMSGLRREARTSVARSLFLDRDDVGREYALHGAMRGRLSRTRQQYEEARRNAVRMAFLARLAIEQRLGFSLSEFDRDMTLVEAPARWADSVCTLSGVDFIDVWTDPSTGVPPDEDGVPRGIVTIADYVARLRLVLDSYLLDYPFVNGSDTAVLSLDGDILRTRGTCSVPGPNMLVDSESLASSGHWGGGCAASTAGLACPIVALPGGQGPFLTREPTDGVAVRSLGGGTPFVFSVACDTPPCGGPFGLGEAWTQAVTLEPGEYVLSWYERSLRPVASPADHAVLGPVVRPSTPGGVVSVVEPTHFVTLVADGGPDLWMDETRWRRRYTRILIAEPTSMGEHTFEVGLAVATQDAAVGGVADGATNVVFAGIELESPDAFVFSTSLGSATPTPYFRTDGAGTAPVGACDDPTGASFRERFVRHCELVCAAGAGTLCADVGSENQRCYWETTFNISLDLIERGELIPSGGFAIGNFNYRTDSVAINLVGTAVRDCSRVEDAASCYASGYVPFSLYHDGGFTVRNHDGEEYGAPAGIAIFPGRILFARSLAAERYLTNPISGADRGLIADYVRTEFRGRPLNGLYRLRIYDTPGFDWNAVEDIQVLLSYRYWTRQE